VATAMKTPPPPRLSLVRAARAPIAVIFRRGPSKRVQVVRWDFSNDSFERGDWFHGRIYSKRSDLSPNGELLACFAASFGARRPDALDGLYSWTMITHAPSVVPIALWPKGDCWWGGALFTGDRSLWLNHRPDEATPHPELEPKGFRVEANPGAHGEDEPIYKRRLERDGWMLRQEWDVEYLGPPLFFRTIKPDIRAKVHPDPDVGLTITMERRLDRFSYRERFQVHGVDAEPQLPPGPLEWLDWDSRGRIIALSGGRVWAAPVAGATVARFQELIDLRDDRPEPVDNR